MTEIMTESTQSNQSTRILDADSAWGTGGHTKTAEFVSAEQDLNSICQTACERRAGSPVVVHQALGRAVRSHSPRTPFRDHLSGMATYRQLESVNPTAEGIECYLLKLCVLQIPPRRLAARSALIESVDCGDQVVG